LVARLIIFLYSSYPVNLVSANSLRLLLGNNEVDADQTERTSPLSIHASVYALADKYECPLLKEACQNAYIRTLNWKFSISDFISSIHVIYETTPETDRGLRKWAVFVAQGYKAMLVPHQSFRALFMTRPTFSWDLTTGYMEDQKYWCENCEANALLKYDCICGQNGICLANDECESEEHEFWCTECGSWGIKPGSLAAASDEPRSRFKHEAVDNVLQGAVDRMED
jgi:hypothetical protein